MRKATDIIVLRESLILGLLLLGLSLIVLLVSVSSQSLWIDEGITVWFASQGSLHALLNVLRSTTMAESLMPGYVLYTWFWVHFVGLSEFTLRLSNFPFIVLVLACLAFGPIPHRKKVIMAVLLSSSPLLWFYMNEVRTYIPLFSCSALSVLGIGFYFYGDDGWRRFGPYITAVSLLIGTFLNLSCVFSAASLTCTFLLVMLTERKTKWHELRAYWIKPLLIVAPFFLLLGIYYSVTLATSVGGRLGESLTRPTLRHIAFSLYELLGFSGLGPPRNTLRAFPSVGTFAAYWYLLAPFGVILLVVLTCGFIAAARRRHGDRFLSPYILLTSFIVGYGVFFLFALSTKFVFYGRHIIFLYPYFLFALASLLDSALGSRVNWRAGLICLLVLMLLISACRLRFLPSYRKDDYRETVKMALDIGQKGATIYWAADRYAGAFYGLRYGNDDLESPRKWPNRRTVKYAANWRLEQIISETNIEGGILILSKPDLYDRDCDWRRFVSLRNSRLLFQLPAFTAYDIR